MRMDRTEDAKPLFLFIISGWPENTEAWEMINANWSSDSQFYHDLLETRDRTVNLFAANLETTTYMNSRDRNAKLKIIGGYTDERKTKHSSVIRDIYYNDVDIDSRKWARTYLSVIKDPVYQDECWELLQNDDLDHIKQIMCIQALSTDPEPKTYNFVVDLLPKISEGNDNLLIAITRTINNSGRKDALPHFEEIRRRMVSQENRDWVAGVEDMHRRGRKLQTSYKKESVKYDPDY